MAQQLGLTVMNLARSLINYVWSQQPEVRQRNQTPAFQPGDGMLFIARPTMGQRRGVFGVWQGDSLREMPDRAALAAEQKLNRDQTLQRVYHTYFLLQQVTNPDVARLIIPHLELYESWHNQMYFTPLFMVQDRDSPACVLVSNPIRSRVRHQNPVRKVSFELESHDQGYANDMNGGSWTWFSVAVVPASGEQVTAMIEEQNEEVISVSGQMRPSPRPPEAIVQLMSALTQERELYRNPIAHWEWETHAVTWSTDSSDSTEAAWVKALKPGDRIVVLAHARFPGWQNSVRSVSVTIKNAPML